MKLVSFGAAGGERPGVVRGDMVVDLTAASGGELTSVRALLEQGEAGLDRVRRWLDRPDEGWLGPLAGMRLGPPITNPTKIVCVGLNYHGHAKEQSKQVPSRPLLFSKAVTALAGSGDPIWYPAEDHNLDYEAELAFVIGRTGFRIAPDRWREHVAGYTIVNDVSGRDAQFADKKWFRGKSYDSCCPMGPWLVTADEIPEPHDLAITSRLNGELRQQGHTSDLIFRIPDLLAYASRNMTMVPGDVFSTGTPAGVGIFRDPPACMKPGDEVRVELERVGELVNRVAERGSEGPSPYPAPRI